MENRLVALAATGPAAPLPHSRAGRDALDLPSLPELARRRLPVDLTRDRPRVLGLDAEAVVGADEPRRLAVLLVHRLQLDRHRLDDLAVLALRLLGGDGQLLRGD